MQNDVMEIANPYEADFEYRGPAIIFHDTNHLNDAKNLSTTLTTLNFRCQLVDHTPSHRGKQRQFKFWYANLPLKHRKVFIHSTENTMKRYRF
jgi:hypothetical protein